MRLCGVERCPAQQSEEEEVITRDVPVERDCNTITVLLLLLFQINNQSNQLLSNPADAQRVLQQGRLLLEGAVLVVTKMEVEEAIGGAESTPAKSRATVDVSSDHILEIRGFKPGTATDMVEMFIENESGEMELHSFEYDEKKGVAVVAFNCARGKTTILFTLV